MGRLSELLGTFHGRMGAGLADLPEPEFTGVDIPGQAAFSPAMAAEEAGAGVGEAAGTFVERLRQLPGGAVEGIASFESVIDKIAQGIEPSPDEMAGLVSGIEAASTAVGPFSVAAGQEVERATGSKLAGLLAEVAVSIPETAGLATAPKAIKGLLGRGAKRAVREVAEDVVTPDPARFAEFFANPQVKEALTPDPDFISKHFPPPEPLLAPGSMELQQMVDGAVAGHAGSFRQAGIALGIDPQDMELIVRSFATDVKRRTLSKEVRSALYKDFLEGVMYPKPPVPAGAARRPVSVSSSPRCKTLFVKGTSRLQKLPKGLKVQSLSGYKTQ
ncbi:MAG: hypothetical protein ACXAEN_27170 [Candidatus Thorarchaeota archaeon]|jgi:hypothetical protein